MLKFSALTLLAGVFAVLMAERAAAAPVTWDFIVTSCNTARVGHEGCDPAAQYPVTLATLTLSGPDSSGSAVLPYLIGSPVLTGDPFAFDLVARTSHLPAQTSTAEPLGPPPIALGVDPEIVDYNISWTETAGVLTAVNISFLTEQDEVNRLGLTAGQAGSDGELAGCSFALCQVSGYWVDAPVMASEPGMLGLWMLGFLGLIGVRYRARIGESRCWGVLG